MPSTDVLIALQVGENCTATCRVEYSKGHEVVSILNSLPDRPVHLSSKLCIASSHATFPVMSQPKIALAATHLVPKVQEGPVASISVKDRRNAGYRCHPAVADSSMHIGIVAGRTDDRVRIPGWLFNQIPLDLYHSPLRLELQLASMVAPGTMKPACETKA